MRWMGVLLALTLLLAVFPLPSSEAMVPRDKCESSIDMPCREPDGGGGCQTLTVNPFPPSYDINENCLPGAASPQPEPEGADAPAENSTAETTS